jgi:uncharacterized protein (TIGR02246 family)
MNNPSAETEIRAVIDTWMKATAAGDLNAVLSLMAEDVVFLRAGHPPMRGRNAYAAESQNAVGKVRFEGKADVKEIQVSGDLAYCWNYLTLTITPSEGGPTQKREGHILSVFRRAPDGRWVLFRDANFVA